MRADENLVELAEVEKLQRKTLQYIATNLKNYGRF